MASKEQNLPIKTYTVILILLWTCTFILTLNWTLSRLNVTTLEGARIAARVAHEKDITYRRWNAVHGGVYVPVTEETPPSEHLANVPERDITTPSGKKLTLINPAYMTRQAHELTEGSGGIRGHITSFKPFSKENAPDDWEREALKAFENGLGEYSSVEMIGEREYMRLMRPLVAKKPCLKCHEKQGYKEGDVRGGISAAIPMEPLWTALSSQRRFLLTLGVSMWAAGVLVLVIGSTLLLKSERRRNRVQEKTDELFNKVKTAKQEWMRTVDCMTGNLVILADSDDRIVRSNRIFSDFIGSSYDELHGRNWMEVLGAADLTIMKQSGDSQELFQKKTGGWFILNTYTYEVTGELESGETAAGTVIIIHDVTKLKEAAAEIEEKNSELEEAYAKLKSTQATILQQEKMASIGHLAAGVAHEINNPMSFITSNLVTLSKYSQRLLEFIELQGKALSGVNGGEVNIKAESRRLKIDVLSEDILDMINESLDGAERVKKIVKDLKVFSREDTLLQSSYVDIHEVIDSSINIVWNEVKYKAKLTKEYGEIPKTRCFPQQLSQVIMNILVNAAQAIEKHGEICIRTREKGGEIFMDFTDTGKGIPEDVLPRIFDPFFTTKEVGEGTGLGLSICYDIVKNHHGDITIASKLGCCTTFTVRIPVVPDDDQGGEAVS